MLSLYSYFRFCFRHIKIYSSIVQEHIHAYSEPCVSLAYSEPWHVRTTKHIQTYRYIHNTRLNFFTKAPSWTFDTILNGPLFYRCYLTSTVTLRYLLALYFRHFLTHSRLIQTYLFLLRHIKKSGIFRNILLLSYSGIF